MYTDPLMNCGDHNKNEDASQPIQRFFLDHEGGYIMVGEDYQSHINYE